MNYFNKEFSNSQNLQPFCSDILNWQNKQILLIGVKHTANLPNESFDFAKKHITKFAPETVFLETSPRIGEKDYLGERLKRIAEEKLHDEVSLLIKFCMRGKIDLQSAEPSLVDEFNYLQSIFGVKDVVEFFDLRMLDYFHRINKRDLFETKRIKTFTHLEHSLNQPILNLLEQVDSNTFLSKHQTIDPYKTPVGKFGLINRYSILFRERIAIQAIKKENHKKIAFIFGYGHFLRLKNGFLDFAYQESM